MRLSNYTLTLTRINNAKAKAPLYRLNARRRRLCRERRERASRVLEVALQTVQGFTFNARI